MGLHNDLFVRHRFFILRSQLQPFCVTWKIFVRSHSLIVLHKQMYYWLSKMKQIMYDVTCGKYIRRTRECIFCLDKKKLFCEKVLVPPSCQFAKGNEKCGTNPITSTYQLLNVFISMLHLMMLRTSIFGHYLRIKI